MALDNAMIARDLLAAIGGRNNVVSVVHCATRLRFTLKDSGAANVEQAKKVTGVVTVIEKGGQFQVVIGNAVPEVYKELIKAGDFESLAPTGGGGKANLLNRLIDTISGIFAPLFGVICGGGLIKGLLAICSAAGWLTADMNTYIVINAIGDSVFYFLPVLLGFSAGRKFGGNQYLTAIVGTSLIYPSLVELAGSVGTITFLKIPMVLMNYTSSVIPILFAAYMCCKLEKVLRGKLHTSIKNFITPVLCLLIAVPITLFIIGPVSVYLSDILAKIFMALPDVVYSVVMGAFGQVLVFFGLHWAFVPLMINNVFNIGADLIGPVAFVAAMGQVGAAFGMFIKMKNAGVKSMTLTAVISGLCGITEPIVYGITLPRKKPFYMGMIGGGVGGLLVGLIGGRVYAFGAWGLLCLPTTIDPVNGIGAGFWGTLLGLAAAFAVAAILTFVIYKDDTVVAQDRENSN